MKKQFHLPTVACFHRLKPFAVMLAVRGGDSPATTQIELPKTGALRRFHGSITLHPTRLSRDADVIATSVFQHLTGLLDAKVKITVEIEAEIPLVLLKMWFAPSPRTAGL